MTTTTTKNPLGIYFHIPFCTRKCPYCNFFVLPDKEELKVQLLEGLEAEIKLWQLGEIDTIYFGGGTPALFGEERISRLLQLLPTKQPGAEVTLEINPENATRENLIAFRKSGINRLSFGVQSLHTKTLHTLGRMHSPGKTVEAIHTAKEIGFDNITIDLMYEVPDQTMQSWVETLDALDSLPITHLSLYNLAIEPHTPFYKQREELRKRLPRDEELLKMLESATSKLHALGFERYEITAFAKPGFQSRHNRRYWEGRPFLGFGPSAFSDLDGSRFRNVENLNKYCRAVLSGKSAEDFRETLSAEESFNERLAVHLRLFEGAKLIDPPEETLRKIKRLIEEGLLEHKEDRIRLTAKGKLFYDDVGSGLI